MLSMRLYLNLREQSSMQNNQLYMSHSEQGQSLKTAGFSYNEVLNKGRRALYKAT